MFQSELKKEINSIVDQVSASLKAKCRSGVAEFCSTKCKGALFSLLSEESLSLAVCEMCVKIASRMSEERVISWMQNHATLSECVTSTSTLSKKCVVWNSEFSFCYIQPFTVKISSLRQKKQ